jgi:DNA-binding LytR/AlgR family response regulator
VKVDIESIVAVESKQNYIMIHTKQGNVLTHMTLTEISTILKGYKGFAQFQRSFIISIQHIDYIYGNSIKMHGGLEVTVGDYYRKEFSAFLSSKLLKGKTT